jgi:hypothetical protein
MAMQLCYTFLNTRTEEGKGKQMSGNVSHTDDLKPTPKQDTFIQAQLAGNSIVASAKIAGCNEKTAHAWLKLPSVQKAYRDAQHVLFNEALAGLMLDVGEARATLLAIMKDSEATPSVRVRAAQILLEQSIQIHKCSEIEAKLTELESLVKDQGGKK